MNQKQGKRLNRTQLQAGFNIHQSILINLLLIASLIIAICLFIYEYSVQLNIGKFKYNYKPAYLPPFQDGTIIHNYKPLTHQKHQKPMPWQSLIPLKKEVTFVAITNGRYDLLQKTIDSFISMNGYPIKEYLIMNDGPTNQNYEKLQKIYKQFKFFTTSEKVGQLMALDILYSKIETDYFFHTEDDWQFIKANMIEFCMDRMEQDSRIHNIFLFDKKNLKQQRRVKKSSYSGLNFTPSLRRLRDYKLVGSYAELTQNKTLGLAAGPYQRFLSSFYRAHGYHSLIAQQPYIKHLGGGRGSKRQRNVKLPNPIKDEV